MRTIPDIMYAWADNRPDKVITRISPSMIGRCMRTHFYAIHGVKPTTPPSPGAQLDFKVGFMWEEVMRDALRNASIPFLEQHHMIDEELNLEGTLDFAPYNQETSNWEIWDSKTEGAMAANYRKREGKSFFNAHPEYVHQLNAYCIMLERQGFEISTGRFGIIVKDNGMVSEDITTFPEASLNDTLRRIQTLNQYLEDNELPPCECEGWQINYCSYGDPESIEKNKTGKMVPTKCCDIDWREF